MGLDEVMSCRETDVQTADKGRTVLHWTGDELPGLHAGEARAGRWCEETLGPLGPQAHVVAKFPGGGAAAIMSTYGKGKTLMLGSYTGGAYEKTREASGARFYAALLEWAGVHAQITVD